MLSQQKEFVKALLRTIFIVLVLFSLFIRAVGVGLGN